MRLLPLLLLLLAALPAAAQDYPTRPIKMVVSYPAGGANDIVARSVGQVMSQDLGQSIVVENKSGAGGMIGADSVAKAAPDGYTLLMAGGAHALAPSLTKAPPYDLLRDFRPISNAAASPYLLVVHPAVPAHSVAELVALARAKPGALAFASSGVGAPPHLAGVLFQKLSGTELNHVPYRGDTPALNDLIAGQVQIYFSAVSSATAHLRAGAMRALAVTSKARSSALPDIPSLDESGLPGYDLGTWWGLLAPADARADRAEAQRLAPQGGGDARGAGALPRSRAGAARRVARGVRRLHPPRGRAVRRDRQAGGRRAGMTARRA